MSNKKSRLFAALFRFGAGSIRAYPRAENTGLVISDDANIHIILISQGFEYKNYFWLTPKATPCALSGSLIGMIQNFG
ncbi:MAG: hypothetical protein J6T12_06410 [Salinivirgaceae bacterium]|nr:hypothetical protein [Salinivirgaceae bacterium]